MNTHKIVTSDPDEYAVIYCRVSGEVQNSNLSLKSQEDYCRKFCLSQGWKVDKVFIDTGMKARADTSPLLKEALSYAVEHKSRVSAFVAYQLDRISRNICNYFVVKTRLANAGIKIVWATQYSGESAESKLRRRILEILDKYEAQVIGCRANAIIEKA